MADCSNTPTPESTANFDLDSRCFSEAMTSNADYTTARASDGGVKKTYAAALRDAGWKSAGEWSTNPLLTEPNQYVFYNNQRFAPVNLPYQVDSATNPDPNALVPGELRDVSSYSADKAQSELMMSEIFPQAGSILKNGDIIPMSTKYVRLTINGQDSIVMIQPQANGVVSNLSESGADIGGQSVIFNTPAFEKSKEIQVTSERFMLDYDEKSGVTISTDDPTDSIRESCVVWHQGIGKYCLVADVVPSDAPSYPDSFNTELGLWTSVDLISWEYIGICIEKGAPLGEYGVGTPSGMIVRDGKILCPFSARQNSSYSLRYIGIAESPDDPTQIPWTKYGPFTKFSGGGFDDDPALVELPHDGNVYLYYRQTKQGENKKIVVKRSLSPLNPDSYSDPVVVIEDPTVSYELTDAFYYNNQIHLMAISSVVSSSGARILHQASYVAESGFEDFNQGYPLMESRVSGLFNGGHPTTILRNSEVVGMIWGSGTNPYKLNVFKSKIRAKQFNDNKVKLDNFGYSRVSSAQEICGGRSTIYAKVNFNEALESTSDTYTIMYKGTDDALDSGSFGLFFTGGDRNGIRLLLSDGTNRLDLTPSVDLSNYMKGDLSIFITIDYDSKVKLTVVTDSDVLCPIEQVTTWRYDNTGDTYIGTLPNNSLPLSGGFYESGIFNRNITVDEMQSIHKNTYDFEYVEGDTAGGCRSRIVANSGSELFDKNPFMRETIAYSNTQVSPECNNYGTVLCRKWAASTQSIPDSSWVDYSYGGVISDGLNISTSPSENTIPRAGIYTITASAAFSSNATGIRAIRIVEVTGLGDTILATRNVEAISEADSITDIFADFTGVIRKNSIIKVQVRQTSGGSLSSSASDGLNIFSLISIP